MTEKRFRVNELVKYNYSEIGEYIDENHTDSPLRNDEVVELLNELHEENEQLKCGNKNLKAILNDFMNICNRLQSNPNDKQTLNVTRDMLQNMGVDLE